ncbi:transposase [Polaromonas hydrogenivorans]|uniref:Transposase n=1 Tax=Polaromonas hydrogenivorans TaxID=335476 RepID=A0AAU7LVG0_9BURK
MQRLQAFKYELMPNGGQQRTMRRFAGACRFAFNKALALQKANHAAGSKFMNYVALANKLPGWKQEFEWLGQAPSQALQQMLKDLERAWKNFFDRRAAFPKFKKKGQCESFRFPQGFRIDQSNSRIFLPKLGWMRYRNSREILGVAKNITISEVGGKWLASIQTEREVEQPIPAATTAIGIDVGIARFATMSDGSFVAPLCSFKKHEKRLAKYQRRMSRKTRFSKNWHKAKRKVQKVHADIANTRKDFLHKTTSDLSKNHAMVAIEDLQVRNMSKSAAGNAEKPGKNVAAKSGLNKAILDQGWFEFRRQLEYKLDWNGGILIAVPPQYTSQTCPCCGHVAKENRQTQARFECVDCGYQNHVDVVGAMNILARGYRVAACGEEGSGRSRKTPTKPASVKQEPTEATMQEATHV